MSTIFTLIGTNDTLEQVYICSRIVLVNDTFEESLDKPKARSQYFIEFYL